MESNFMRKESMNTLFDKGRTREALLSIHFEV